MMSLERPAIAYFAVVTAVVLAARLGLYPGAGETFPASPVFGHPYRLAMAATSVLLAVLLGIVSAHAGRRLGNGMAGLAALLAGGIGTGLLLGAAPWTLYPSDRYPVVFIWLLVGAPVALATWVCAMAALRPPEGDEGV